MDINNINTKMKITSLNQTASQAKAAQQPFKAALAQASEPTGLDAIFSKASKTYGVSEKLLRAVAQAESGMDPNAVSKCGAQGIMQLMPKTAKALGVTDPLDPAQSITGGAKYLAQMLKRYDGNETLALAAYNAGPGNVQKYGGVPPFRETQNYIAKISKLMNGELKSSSVSSASTKNVEKASEVGDRTAGPTGTGPAMEPVRITGYSLDGGFVFPLSWNESFDPIKADEDTALLLLQLFALENL